MSQEELAEKCNLHPTYIGQLERGEKNATLESIEKVAKGLSISLSQLFENIEEEQSSQTNYPIMAYQIIQTLSDREQEQMIKVLRDVIDFKSHY